MRISDWSSDECSSELQAGKSDAGAACIAPSRSHRLRRSAWPRRESRARRSGQAHRANAGAVHLIRPSVREKPPQLSKSCNVWIGLPPAKALTIQGRSTAAGRLLDRQSVLEGESGSGRENL